MTLSETFKLRMAVEERRQLTALSQRLERTQSDTVRLLIRKAAKRMLIDADGKSGQLVKMNLQS